MPSVSNYFFFRCYYSVYKWYYLFYFIYFFGVRDSCSPLIGVLYLHHLPAFTCTHRLFGFSSCISCFMCCIFLFSSFCASCALFHSRFAAGRVTRLYYSFITDSHQLSELVRADILLRMRCVPWFRSAILIVVRCFKIISSACDGEMKSIAFALAFANGSMCCFFFCKRLNRSFACR